MAADPLVHVLATFPDTTPVYRFWSGADDLTLDGETYQGRSFIALSPAEASLEAPDRRMTASFHMGPLTTAQRIELLQDPGPLTVQIEWIASTDQGQSWTRMPRKFVGRLSRPAIRNGIYTIEIETYGGDVDRGRPLKWSHEDQQGRFPGDLGSNTCARLRVASRSRDGRRKRHPNSPAGRLRMAGARLPDDGAGIDRRVAGRSEGGRLSEGGCGLARDARMPRHPSSPPCIRRRGCRARGRLRDVPRRRCAARRYTS